MICKIYTNPIKRIFCLTSGIIFLLSSYPIWADESLNEINGAMVKRQAELSEYLDRISKLYTEPSSGATDSVDASNKTLAQAPVKTDSVSVQQAPSVNVNKSPGSSNQEILVDLDLREADMKDVARALSRISGKNIIVNDEVKAKVAMRVKNMSWKEALNMILETYGLTMLEKKNYIVITTFEKRRAVEESGDLQTKIVTLNFVDVTAVQKTLTSMLTKRGKMETDIRTNSLVITDIPDIVNTIERVALQLDTKTPQVMIEALMITVKLNDDEKLGIDWDITHKDRPERELKQSLGLGGTAGTDYLWQIKYGKTLLPWANFSATLEFLLEQRRAEILANPRVLTLDNLPANIDLTEQVPYTQQSTSTESSSSVTSVQFKDVPVKLIVKPHITKDNYIIMNVQTEQSYRSGFVSNQPIIDSRKAETNVMVRDGETIVIGGLRKKEDASTVNKLPILGDIPFLGALFRKTVNSKVDTELIIFVTPYIATDTRLSEIEKKRVEDLRLKSNIDNTLQFDKYFPRESN
jgi:type IV pilus assembly protein PilQ